MVDRYIHCTDGHNLPPRPGLGFMIFALAEAFLYAHVTGRTLVVDWRDTAYLADQRVNLFDGLFAPLVLSRVKIVHRNIDEILHNKSQFIVDSSFYQRFIGRWGDTRLGEWSEFWNDIAKLRSESAIDPIGRSAEHYAFANFPLKFISDQVIQVPFIGGILAYTSPVNSIADRFIRTLALRSPYHEVCEEFKETHFNGKQVVGVHVRHGNGEKGDFIAKRRQIRDLDYLLDRIRHKIESKPSIRADKYTTFLCTDSDIVVHAARRKFKNLITRRQWRPNVDTGCSLYLGHLCPEGEIENAANAAIDMFLLGSCDYLAQVDEGSWFTKVAARRIGFERVIRVDARAPDIKWHVFPCAALPSAVESRAVGRESVGKAGHLVHGPYVEIDNEARYCAELSYLTRECPGPVAGNFEVTVSGLDENGRQTGFQTLAHVDLPATDGMMREARVEFDTTGLQGMLLETRVYVAEAVIMNAFHIRTWRHGDDAGKWRL